MVQTPPSMALKSSFFSISPNSASNFRRPSLTKHSLEFLQLLKPKPPGRIPRELKLSAAAMFSTNTVVSDLVATGLSGGIALSLLKIWEQTAKNGVFDQVWLLYRNFDSFDFMLPFQPQLSCFPCLELMILLIRTENFDNLLVWNNFSGNHDLKGVE